MGKLRWYKRDPNAALVGMRVLNCEERGAYNTVLDLIYAHDGAVVDDDRYLAGECGLSVRRWRTIRAHLIDLGKIIVEAGQLTNNRAKFEVEKGLNRIESAKQAGEISAQKKAASKSKNNNLDQTTVDTETQRPFQQSTPTPTSRTSEDKSSEGRKHVSRGTRLAVDWKPTDADRKFGIENGLDPPTLERETLKFRNYWTSKAGASARKVDWSRTWQNWILNINPSGGQHGPRSSIGGARQSAGADFFAGLAEVAQDIAGESGVARPAGAEIPRGRHEIDG